MIPWFGLEVHNGKCQHYCIMNEYEIGICIWVNNLKCIIPQKSNQTDN